MAETQAVARMLGEAMRDGQHRRRDREPAVAVAPVNDPRFETLGHSFPLHAVPVADPPGLAEGRIRLAGERTQADAGRRPDAINTWAYERFDDPIIVDQGEELRRSISSH